MRNSPSTNNHCLAEQATSSFGDSEGFDVGSLDSDCGKSQYASAIDRTSRTVETRSRRFRNLVVVYVVVTVSALASAAVWWSFAPFAGLIMLVPACGFFALQDRKLLDDWRSNLLAKWAMRDLDFQALRDAVVAIPTLPKETLNGMLATLPCAADIRRERGISSSTRQVAATAVRASDACSADSLAFKWLGCTIIAIACLVTIISDTWQPLLGSLVVLVLPPLLATRRQARIAVARKKLQTLRQRGDFDPEACSKLLHGLEVNRALLPAVGLPALPP
jgi:hypothetical protein